MGILWQSFIYGWRASAALWHVVLLTYVVDAASAMAMTMPLASQLSGVFGHSTLAPELYGPLTLDWLVELQQGANLTSFPWLLYLAVPLLSTLATTFLRGGILGSLAPERAALFRWRDFFGDCARYFWRFLLIMLLVVPGFLLVISILLATLQIGFGPGGGGLDLGPAIARAVLGMLLLLLLPTIMDYARVSLVLDPPRSLVRHVGRSIKFVAMRFLGVLLLGISFWMSAASAVILWPVLLALSPFFGSFWAAFLVQQLSSLLMSWQRVAMLGGETAFFRTHSGREERQGVGGM